MVQYYVLFIMSNTSKTNLIQLNNRCNFIFQKANEGRIKTERICVVMGCKLQVKSSLLEKFVDDAKYKDRVKVFCIVFLVLKYLKQRSTRTC